MIDIQNIIFRLDVKNTSNINDVHINILYKDVDGVEHQIYGDIRNDYIVVTKNGVDITNDINRLKISTDLEFLVAILNLESLSDFDHYVSGCYINISD